MRWIITLLLLVFVTEITAQDETVRELRDGASVKIEKEEDTTGKVWRKGGLLNLNLAQGSLSNWAAGGDEFSLSLNSLVSLFAFYKKDRHSWDNTLNFNIGYIRTTSLGTRKNDDRFDVVSKYGYALNDKLNLSTLVNFRTQLFNGFTFTEDSKVLSSAFLSPAYILVSEGLDFKPSQHFSLFISPLTARWVIVADDSLSAVGMYGVEPGSHSRNELGAFLSLNYQKEFNAVVGYVGRLELFSNYRNNPQNIDLFMTNLLSVKISKLISVTWNVDLIYDDDAKLFGPENKSPALQVKSLVGAGLLVKF